MRVLLEIPVPSFEKKLCFGKTNDDVLFGYPPIISTFSHGLGDGSELSRVPPRGAFCWLPLEGAGVGGTVGTLGVEGVVGFLRTAGLNKKDMRYVRTFQFLISKMSNSSFMT